MLGNQFEIFVWYEIAKEFSQHYAESFDLFDLYGVVQLAFTKERLPGESRQYYTQAYLLERHVHNLTNKIYVSSSYS